jgi:hypothetical protein
MDARGNALLARGADGIEVFELRGSGPLLTKLVAPRTGETDVAVRFSVQSVPWASPLAGRPLWQFGDGESASGATVEHRYSSAGTYTVSVLQSDAAGGASTSAATLVVAPLMLANTRAPSVHGIARVGATLTCLPGTWVGRQPIRIAYAWLRGKRAIPAATRQRYRLQEADAGALVGCRVTAKNAARSLQATSQRVRVRG